MTRANVFLRLSVLLATALVGGSLVACAAPQPAAAPDAPEYLIATDKTDNVVTATADGDRLLVEVHSASGIGSAGVRAAQGQLPPSVTLRFYLAGLEQMTFAFGDAVVKLSVPSGDQPVLQSVVEAGQESPLTPESPYWMEVTKPAAAGDPFEVSAPPAFAAAAPSNFTLGWIDFYR
ncbi:MAG TPA: hypothetical protein PKM78_05525 [Anaerolineae bacterium]|nr:hypothetical protein [Anaerolineae bacterium]HNU04092.1 hypothetical protein [Anaerolineae bacterium]